MSSNNPFSDPKIVGPGVWFAIHKLAKKAITPELKRNFIEFMTMICNEFKCLKCRTHCQEYMKLHPIRNYMNITDSKGRDIGMFKWTWEFHNSVNARLGKSQMPFDEADHLYDADSEICMDDCGGEDHPDALDSVAPIRGISNTQANGNTSKINQPSYGNGAYVKPISTAQVKGPTTNMRLMRRLDD